MSVLIFYQSTFSQPTHQPINLCIVYPLPRNKMFLLPYYFFSHLVTLIHVMVLNGLVHGEMINFNFHYSLKIISLQLVHEATILLLLHGDLVHEAAMFNIPSSNTIFVDRSLYPFILSRFSQIRAPLSFSLPQVIPTNKTKCLK